MWPANKKNVQDTLTFRKLMEEYKSEPEPDLCMSVIVRLEKYFKQM